MLDSDLESFRPSQRLQPPHQHGEPLVRQEPITPLAAVSIPGDIPGLTFAAYMALPESVQQKVWPQLSASQQEDFLASESGERPA